MNSPKICIIGTGYVGLPLACLFSTRYPTVGYDTDPRRVNDLRQARDTSLQVDAGTLRQALANGLEITADINEIHESNVFIVTVPTPVDSGNRPDLRPLREASETVGRLIRPSGAVIYESTVYPGVTEDICLPIVEQTSGLNRNSDFIAGYSPERINPGDSAHTLENTVKITSGTTPEAAEFIDSLYRSIITAGTHRAPAIRVAEAAKIIENAQRDVNIAFINEAARIFNAMEIDTGDVIEAAATKWNFITVKPGLVGGHCIGVDPYYLIEQARSYGITPRIMTAARDLNNSMGEYVANRVIRLMNLRNIPLLNARILILGFTFKEDCTDCRNTRVADIIHTIGRYTGNIDVYDPVADRRKVMAEYGITLLDANPCNEKNRYDAIILAVAHREFKNLDFNRLRSTNSVLYDVKSALPKNIADERL
jgi:UDP-N-acetyl-D-galactosamine dehydrogenase